MPWLMMPDRKTGDRKEIDGEERDRIVYASVLYIKLSLEEKYEEEDFIHGNDPASIKSRPEMSLLYSLSQSVVQ